VWILFKGGGKEDPPKSAQVTMRINGKIMVGVILDPDEGWRPGVYKLRTRSSEECELLTDVATSEDTTTQGAVVDTFAQLQKRMRVETQHVASDENVRGSIEHRSIKAPQQPSIRKLKPEDSESSDDFLGLSALNLLPKSVAMRDAGRPR